MSNHTSVLSVRISAGLRATIRQGGELSAATRALLIIGAATSCLDLSDVYEEIAELLGGRLRPEVRAQLLVLITGRSERPGAVPAIEPMADDLYVDDELLLGDVDGAGFDV